ncbi:MAG: hypothetical protein KZQ62_05710 [Candidatus Thiodiazotropha sp. (ex Lucinoma aequizonata)]|nr:hypothetical protein [Candidatus Thiodiazotropha sp. (ex Lucinoma aequizonata)]
MCEMLCYDPLFLTCEVRVVAVVDVDHADQALTLWRNQPGGDLAALIGERKQADPYVVLHAELGGARILEELENDPLPRIC